MSNWLGFSLTPHLRIDHQGNFVNRDEQEQPQSCFSTTHHHHEPPLTVMPLRSDGSLSLHVPQGNMCYSVSLFPFLFKLACS